MTTPDSTASDSPDNKPDSPPSTLPLWHRYWNEIWIVLFVLVAYGPPVVESVAFFSGVSETPLLGRPVGYSGAYLKIAFEMLIMLALGFAFVRPREMGLFLPFSKPTRIVWLQVFWMAALLLVGTFILRMILVNMGVPGTRFPPGDPAIEFAYLASAGVTEQVAAAVTIILMLRARWSWSLIVAIVTTLQVTYHLYQGAFVVAPAILFAGSFALLFLHYRRVGPLIAAHTAFNLCVGLFFT